MTDAEIEYLKFLDFTESEIKSINNFPYFGTPQFYAFKSGYERGFEKGRKENDIVWHDLRKNPDDLPKEKYGTYYCKLQGIVQFFYSYVGFINGKFDNSNEVIAWCEIPTFEGE